MFDILVSVTVNSVELARSVWAELDNQVIADFVAEIVENDQRRADLAAEIVEAMSEYCNVDDLSESTLCNLGIKED